MGFYFSPFLTKFMQSKNKLEMKLYLHHITPNFQHKYSFSDLLQRIT
ncbi:conserved hypothetical protein [Xenorhabdus nematophila F1]|uniref:Uncharacterized protein n=1 Tax=Xenorhabdus nematophila (strain ATCC 19061 / DSM 3370 / CCUG 14189 / LMG 1036 / NCIMB 9965 / AN6) TaxID=406817 RepID=D3VJ05_XENNA|nr:conserved hypothetical protein [Xenorhabdus nematophila ATCC 19061]CCW29358.1 conserved hypothetical protein [Xenorhabdus nematophila F1]CEE90288.1 conserved hypothetical protein [Xenorhabdus nematophila str. Anatoliense]CEF28431.1 conserved hypothetical protein [Xenorhabdus nematophila str. Websteri]CEK23697.1 conserved hypothetical protein [Xenorhabdus nematophila AN6/1]